MKISKLQKRRSRERNAVHLRPFGQKSYHSGKIEDSDLIAFRGKIQALSAWAKEYNIDAATLRMRLVIGWPIEKALTRPL